MSYEANFEIKLKDLTPEYGVKKSIFYRMMKLGFIEHDFNSKQPETIVN